MAAFSKADSAANEGKHQKADNYYYNFNKFDEMKGWEALWKLGT